MLSKATRTRLIWDGGRKRRAHRVIMERLLGTPVGGTVLDPFAGSGTTLLAAKSAGVKAIGIEREARFCDVAISRLTQSRMQFAELPS